jgi:hypothetical protein
MGGEEVVEVGGSGKRLVMEKVWGEAVIQLEWRGWGSWRVGGELFRGCYRG